MQARLPVERPQWLARDHLAVQTEVPVANEQTLARLPNSATEAHHQFLATLHSGPSANHP